MWKNFVLSLTYFEFAEECQEKYEAWKKVIPDVRTSSMALKRKNNILLMFSPSF